MTQLPNKHFDDMDDDLPWVEGTVKGGIGSVENNTAILKTRGFVRGCYLMATPIDGQSVQSGTRIFKYLRGVRGDLGTIIVRDMKSLHDFRLKLSQWTVSITKKTTKKQTTRMVLISCAHIKEDDESVDFQDADVFRIRCSRRALETFGLPICPCGNKFELQEGPSEKEMRKDKLNMDNMEG